MAPSVSLLHNSWNGSLISNSVATGIPRRVAEDDWYNGMLIPKDSTVFLPIWAVHHAEGQGYDESLKFNPDRYQDHHKLANDYAGSADYAKRDKSYAPILLLNLTKLAHHYGYGAGRRMCPGVHLAERNQWRIVAKLLWAFEIQEPKDADGKTFHSTSTTIPMVYYTHQTHIRSSSSREANNTSTPSIACISLL